MVHDQLADAESASPMTDMELADCLLADIELSEPGGELEHAILASYSKTEQGKRVVDAWRAVEGNTTKADR